MVVICRKLRQLRCQMRSRWTIVKKDNLQLSMASLLDFRHEPQLNRFIAHGDGGQCLLEYRRAGNTLHITHTEVPPALQGRGLAADLVAAVLTEVRAQGWRVCPVCSYVRTYMRRHPETQDLLENP